MAEAICTTCGGEEPQVGGARSGVLLLLLLFKAGNAASQQRYHTSTATTPTESRAAGASTSRSSPRPSARGRGASSILKKSAILCDMSPPPRLPPPSEWTRCDAEKSGGEAANDENGEAPAKRACGVGLSWEFPRTVRKGGTGLLARGRRIMSM